MSITTLTFGREFTAAIEAKQVAAQEAERAKFVVEKAEQDKQSAIIRAQVTYLLFTNKQWYSSNSSLEEHALRKKPCVLFSFGMLVGLLCCILYPNI